MRSYVVFLQGGNFNLEVDGRVQPAGFFASRRVDAVDREQASKEAVARLLNEPELEGKLLPNYSIVVKVIHEMPREHDNTYSGFTLFPMDEGL